MEKRKKMLVICPHPENIAPGQRLKYEQYFADWRKNGFDVEVSSFFSKRMQDILYTKGNIPEKIYWVIKGYLKRIKELFKIHQYDLVYIFLWVTPFGFPVMERFFVKRNAHVVYDIDDAIFMKSKSLVNKSADFIRGRGKPFFMMKNAKQVITCTPFLTDVAKKYNANVTDISSTINTHTYQPVNKYINDHKLILGWSGSHSTSQFLYLLKDVLLELNKRKPFKLIVMGDPAFKIDGLDMEAKAWTAETEIPTLQQFDIGIYPLPLDSDWVLGKSGLKALQYMAIGVPVVATAIGANYRIMQNSITGFLVKTPEEWIKKLELLIDHPEIRKSIGEAGRKNVADNYSIDVNAPVYINILRLVCKN
jgi:glycosyltransferase involved in cell wall biosynthesis